MQMKINISLVALVLIIFSPTLFCQNKIFVPRNILTAYENGNRSFDGKPGLEYWQNKSDYKIAVEVDPATHLISGSEEITYFNNSPDSLERIVLRLYPNIYKKGNVRDYAIDPKAVDDGLTVRKISIDGRSINLENRSIYKVTNTLATIYLPAAIPPKSSINLSIDWSFKISDKATLRVGVYDSTTAFVGYWYPQVSVYDDIDGWDYNNYDGQTEFYNDFSNYEVSITIPNKFGVWATGILQNPESVLQINFLVNYKAAQKSDSVIRIITSDDLNDSEIYNTYKATNTWKFKAASVTDFAFAFSDHYLWDGIRTFTDSLNDKQFFVQAIYPVESTDFNLVAEIGGTLVNYFSKIQPAINYPASSLVIFNNGRSGGGMEFPMIINDGSPDEIESTVALTAHEMAHQYFPFFVGTNEQKYAFMDEAWAVMLPFKYMQEFAGINSRLLSTVANYEYLAGTEEDIPPMVTSLSLPYVSYRNSAYNRPSIAYETLRDFLGDELFIRALKEYIHRWNGKHPTPYDFFFTFENVTGQNLSWFWKPWFFDFGYPDLAIKKVEAVDSKTQITIQRLGNVPIPIKLKLIYENESSEEIYYSADIWKEGIEEFKIEHETVQVLKEIQLGDVTIPDSNRENNIFLVH
jgi:hypothetical protein